MTFKNLPEVKPILQLEYKELENLDFLLADFSCFIAGLELAKSFVESEQLNNLLNNGLLNKNKIKSSRAAIQRELRRFKTVAEFNN